MIFRNIVFTAILVGIISGLIYGVFQQSQLSPIIYAAEKIEINQSIQNNHGHEHDHAHEHSSLSQTALSPEKGSERVILTLLVNVLTGISFALVMLSLMAVHDLKSSKPKIDALHGVGWGAVAMLAIFVAPALIGLQPKVPGTVAAALEQQQAWWLFAVIATVLGSAFLYYAPLKLKMIGLVIVLLPQIAASSLPFSLWVPVAFETTDPVAVAALNELSQQFYLMSAIGSALFFLVLGVISGFLVNKFIKLETQSA